MLSKKRLAIVGGGNMGEALLRGLLKVDFIKPGNVFVTDVRTEHLEVLRRNYGVEVTPDNLAAARASDGAGWVAARMNASLSLLPWCSRLPLRMA